MGSKEKEGAAGLDVLVERRLGGDPPFGVMVCCAHILSGPVL